MKQDSGGLNVIMEKARELGTRLFLAPELSQYPGIFPGSVHNYILTHCWCMLLSRLLLCLLVELSLEGEHQYTNASLAIQICQSWLSARKNGTAENDTAESCELC